MNITGTDLTPTDVYRIALDGDTVRVAPAQLQAIDRVHARVQRWGAERHPIYGVNTGFGELIHMIVPVPHKTRLQENLIRTHAAGGGDLLPDEIVRAAMAVRLNCLVKGHSGVSADTLQLLCEFLNRGIHPLVPEQGSLGASGDLAPLSHIALTLIGDGDVRQRGRVRPTAEVLRDEGLRPLSLGYKEGLALVNGTSAMTGAASIALVRAYRLLRLAVLTSADLVQCLGASDRPFDHRGHALKNHAGQVAIARELRTLLEGSGLTRRHGDIMRAISEQTAGSDDVTDSRIYLQNAYSLRCMPQILGSVLDTLDYCSRIVQEEINSCNDNPLVFDDPEETFHGGNFHGQYVGMACDYLNVALAEMGVLAERQINRLLDPHLNNGLPPFLSPGDAGLSCGFEGAQYLATSIASENLDLAAPASIKSIPSNGQNQDVVSMGLIAARRSVRLCRNVSSILAILAAACHQASWFIARDKLSAPVRRFHDDFARDVPLYDDGESFERHLGRMRAVLDSEALGLWIDEVVTFDARQVPSASGVER